ncbi:MAG: bifunctional serine/threonine-protein kinase/formylglycine-generating enzyme family protein [Chthoniobacteraceae bacterium]
MAEIDDRNARVRRALEAALTHGGEGVAWTPAEPSAIASLFPGFEVQALIGRGGMGAVYRARQKSLDRLVAIKLLPFELGVQEDFAERFRREATALARLTHPHIVAVHDFGQADDGHFFIVMEYVDGTDLARRLQAGKLPPAEALAVVRQVCAALEFAHARGVVHRDIKPGNILLDATGCVKVTDFGIARLAGEEPCAPLTSSGVLLGTPDYVAPEQTQPAAVVDHRADIFSVGVMLYELLTGQLPRGVFRPLAQLAPDARAFDRVVTRALQSDPVARYAAVRELSADLAKCDLRRPRRRAWLALLLLIPSLAAFAVWFGWPRRETGSAPVAPARGADRSPPPVSFTNSLGLRFVPSGTPGVLFCTTETRVRDFSTYASALRIYTGPLSMWVNFTGGDEGWQEVQASWKDPGFPQTDEHPVVGVTRTQATAFCAWLTERERASELIGAEDQYRLPTNPEWNVAAGLDAGAVFPSGRYPWGADFPPRGAAGNFASEELRESGGKYAALPVLAGYRDGHAFTAPVGSFAGNARGLHDLGGNVWEWTADSEESRGTLRGGGWGDTKPDKLDAARRISYDRGLRCHTFGFRVVLARKITTTGGNR